MAAETASAEMINSSDLPFIPDSVGSHEMAISNFSQVIFPDVPDFYPPETDISVLYIVTDAIQPSSRDWIGVFRVGWTSPKDYTTYVWAPKPEEDDGSGNKSQTVSFQTYRLPGDDNEFYQFCYVTKQGYVRGASTPFQFRFSTENDNLVECEDENGLIILKTKSDALEEQLGKVNLEKEELQKKFSSLEQEKTEAEKRLSAVSADLEKASNMIDTSIKNASEMEAQISSLKNEQEKTLKRLAKADKRIEMTKEKLSQAESLIEVLKDDVEKLNMQIKEMEKGTEATEKTHIQELQKREIELQQREDEKLQMLDRIRTLSIKQEQLKQSNESDLAENDVKVKSLQTQNDEMSKKIQQIAGERDLFKDQFSKTEISRQQAADRAEMIGQKLEKSKEAIKSTQQKLNVAEAAVQKKRLEMETLSKKCRAEKNKMADALRNSSEQVNALETSKKLLRKELTEVTNERDRLMVEVNTFKKDKEAFCVELKGAESTIHALESQLETVEEKLIDCEKRMLSHDKELMQERRNAEEAEREMHHQILLLRKQLEASDQAVAQASAKSESGSLGSTKDQKTQTKKKKQTSSEVQATDTSNENKESAEETIAELRSQVDDLTNRLAKGAQEYKGKFVECHKLEKKLKKIKQQSAKQTSSSSQTTSGISQEEDAENQGFMNSLHKILMAIADPDSEEQEQGKQLKAKLDSMEKSIETEHSRYIKYKQLYSDEKKRRNAEKIASEAAEEEFKRLLLVEKGKYDLLCGENDMLKAQLSEFMNNTENPAVRHAMTFLRDPVIEELDTEPQAYPHQSGNLQNDEENSFEDAPGFPMEYPHESTTPSGSSDVSDDAVEYPDNGKQGFPPLCSDSSQNQGSSTSVATRSEPISCSPGKVISRQPLRSPPQLESPISRQAQTASSSRKSKSGRKGRKGKSRKSVGPIM